MLKIKVKLVDGEISKKEMVLNKKEVTVQDILDILEINRETVLIRKKNELITEEEILDNGDEIEILRVISGG